VRQREAEMLLRKIAFALAALSLGSGEAKAQSDAELLIAQYGFSFGQQFLGKVVRGKNIWKAFRQTSYEAVPSATLQYTGMKMVGQDYRLALPSQLLMQKGAWFGRQSILGRPIFSQEALTSWELDYFWFNFRLRDGKVLPPRVNVATVGISFYYDNVRLEWRRSLATGVVVLTSTNGRIGNRVGQAGSGVILMRSPRYGDSFRHELVHTHQSIRGNAFSDPLLHQGDSQSRFLPFLRLNLGSLVGRVPATLQEFFGEPAYYSQLHEWEARAYANSPK